MRDTPRITLDVRAHPRYLATFHFFFFQRTPRYRVSRVQGAHGARLCVQRLSYNYTATSAPGLQPPDCLAFAVPAKAAAHVDYPHLACQHTDRPKIIRVRWAARDCAFKPVNRNARLRRTTLTLSREYLWDTRCGPFIVRTRERIQAFSYPVRQNTKKRKVEKKKERLLGETVPQQ